MMLRELFESLKKDNQLKQAMDLSHQMLGDDREMFEAAIHSLRSSDNAEIGIDIYARDQQINARQMEVRRNVLTHLAIAGPTGVNAGLVLVSVVIDIERIGDLTKNIVQLALKHPARLVCGEFEASIQEIESTARAMFSALLECLPTYDRDKAREIMADHWRVNRMADAVIDTLVTTTNPSLACQQIVVTTLYARYLKRISAHLMNIASSVVNPFERIGFRDDAGAGPASEQPDPEE